MEINKIRTPPALILILIDLKNKGRGGGRFSVLPINIHIRYILNHRITMNLTCKSLITTQLKSLFYRYIEIIISF